jgi:hypothetical protein
LKRLEKRLEDETFVKITEGPVTYEPSFFQQIEAEEKRRYEEGLLGRGSAGLSEEERRNIEAGEERLRAALHAELRRVYASAETTEELLKAQIEIQNRLLARLGGEGLPSEAPDSEVLGQGKGDVAGETA